VDETPAQTVGPFLHLALADPALRDGVGDDDGAAVTLRGTVVDGAGAPVVDAVVETWQHAGPFTRCPTDAAGVWAVRTRRPPAVPTLDGTPQAPHVVVSIFARGLLDRLVTRAYFAGEPSNAADPALAAAGPRAAALIAAAEGPSTYRFDIRLQGPGESVFFAV